MCCKNAMLAIIDIHVENSVVDEFVDDLLDVISGKGGHFGGKGERATEHRNLLVGIVLYPLHRLT